MTLSFRSVAENVAENVGESNNYECRSVQMSFTDDKMSGKKRPNGILGDWAL